MTGAAPGGGPVLGLTGPKGAKPWFGFSVGGHFFCLVDGDRHIGVFRNRHASDAVDTVPFSGDESDPRKDLRKLANEWVRQRSVRNA